MITLSVFFSCQKTLDFEDGNSGSGTPPDLSTKINSSVSGFVTDENDAAVKGATVQFGTSSITTDKYGYFEAKNVQVVKEAAVVTVIKPGYFKGIKTYMAKEGKAAFFRIKLIPKTTVGNINAASGGTVTLPNGLSIKLKAGTIVNATTNAQYTGTVNVSAYWINPTAADLNKIMPGDLRGINTDGNLKLLQTFGMAAVELTGSGGELLQIVNGQKATLTLTIPSSLLASAPATIPLWYFDEAKGLWKQEGSATKTGNAYVGDVGHFSFWNWDVPGNFVQFDCTVVNANAQPIHNALVKISVVNNPFNARYGYTDASGYVGGLIPENSQLLLQIFSSFGCSTPSYSQTLTTTSLNVSLGTITISTASFQAVITGTATNCNNTPVTDGYIIMQGGNQFGWYPLSNTGTFSIDLLLCGSPSLNITLIAEDATNQQQSIVMPYTITAGANNIGNIVACANSTQQFFNYAVNNTNYSITDSVFEYANANSINLYATTANYTNTANTQFSSQNIGINSIQNLTAFTCLQITEQTTILNPVSVNITEYGSIGQFISGNFTGTLTGTAPPNNIYTITVNFRTRRSN